MENNINNLNSFLPNDNNSFHHEDKKKLSYSKLIKIVVFQLLIIYLGIGVTYCMNNPNTKDIIIDGSVTYNNKIKIDDSKISYNNDTIENKIDNFNSCISSSTPYSLLDERIITKINELESFLQSSDMNFSFAYKDIKTGFSFSYNEKSEIFAASSAKIATVVYLYDMVAQGKVSLSNVKKYTSNFYMGGTGVIKDKNKGTVYTMQELAEYTIVESDNIAYLMLLDELGRDNIKKYWSNLGVTSLLNTNDSFGSITSKDAVIYFEKLYQFYDENKNILGKELMEYFVNSVGNFLDNGNDLNGHKLGWSDIYLHDNAIFLNQYPYVLSVLTTRGHADFKDYFKEVTTRVEEIHNLYYDTKLDSCKKILDDKR